MRIALVQMNPMLGDFTGNRDKIIEFADKAVSHHQVSLVIFPEMALFGYQPMDLLERDSVFEAQWKELLHLQKHFKKLPPKTAVLVGGVSRSKQGKPYHNSAFLFQRGQKMQVFHKELIPNYGVFDERRHIEPGHLKKNVFTFGNHKILVSICEDMWGWPLENTLPSARYKHNPMGELKLKSTDLILNMSSSPFGPTKKVDRKVLAAKAARRFKAPFVYVNAVGAQDEQIYDGGSFVLNSKGQTIDECGQFQEQLLIVDLKAKPHRPHVVLRPLDELKAALVLGIRDFVTKNGFKKVHLGLSGGIDSALVACLAVEALGPENVSVLALPGPYSAKESLKYAEVLAENLKIQLSTVNIEPIYETTLKELGKAYGPWQFNFMNENLQARARALVLMAYSNQNSSLLLSTSNKSELATGFSTIYGDMCGALAPIGDLLKDQVFALSRYFNQSAIIIPQEIIDRAPSAELRPNQTDQDTLPPYALLDKAVRSVVENRQAPKSETEKRVFQMLVASEFKRWQAPPILRVSDHGFGRGRRFPIAHRARY